MSRPRSRLGPLLRFFKFLPLLASPLSCGTTSKSYTRLPPRCLPKRLHKQTRLSAFSQTCCWYFPSLLERCPFLLGPNKRLWVLDKWLGQFMTFHRQAEGCDRLPWRLVIIHDSSLHQTIWRVSFLMAVCHSAMHRIQEAFPPESDADGSTLTGI